MSKNVKTPVKSASSRGKRGERSRAFTMALSPGAAMAFRTSKEVNEALEFLLRIRKRMEKRMMENLYNEPDPDPIIEEVRQTRERFGCGVR